MPKMLNIDYDPRERIDLHDSTPNELAKICFKKGYFSSTIDVYGKEYVIIDATNDKENLAGEKNFRKYAGPRAMEIFSLFMGLSEEFEKQKRPH